MKTEKMRLDVLLVNRGEFQSREAARRAIMAGLVSRGGEVMDKPGTQVAETTDIQVSRPDHAYVSRGGLKLERALQRFAVSLTGKVVLDVGASTGGFTDCALQHGARMVYAVDVGYGQLAWKLRTDPRVTVMERTNFRNADVTRFNPRPDVTVMDVSFISTRLLLPKIDEAMCGNGDVLSLVKPQFEAGRGRVGKGGIVRDSAVHSEVLESMLDFVYSHGMHCRGLDYSPITGGDGNIEFLAWWRLGQADGPEIDTAGMWDNCIREVVESAWKVHRSGENGKLSD